MTTYNLEGMVLHEYYDIVETSPGTYDWVQSGGAVYQQPYTFVTSLDSDSFSYTVNATLATELEVSLTGLGTPYAITLPSQATEQNVTLYATLLDADSNYSNVMTVSWDDNGVAKSSTILAVGWEWEDFGTMTVDSLTMVINLTGDDFPAFANYSAFEAFISTATMTPTAPAGYQEGDDIALIDTVDYVSKVQDDLIQGVGGNDTLWGGIGHDTMIGGDGADIISGGSEGDEIFGGIGNDRLAGMYGNDTVYGGAGSDTVFGGIGHDWLYGGDDNDTIFGGNGNDRLFGGNNNDELHGGDKNDQLFGGDGDDTLRGGADNDRLFGGLGYDQLYAGAGDDTLTGGGQDDTFIFTSIGAGDANVIRDFELFGTDAIKIENYDANTTTLEVVGSDTLITLDSGATILVEGVTDTTALEAEIFIF